MCSYQPGFYQPQIPMPPNEPVPNVPANQQVVNPPRVEVAANERQRPEIVRMNAQGGPLANDDDEDEMRNRDWLDWVYTFIRFMLLLCILYFYSSLDRFIATFTLVVVVYLWVVYSLHSLTTLVTFLHRPVHFTSTVAFCSDWKQLNQQCEFSDKKHNFNKCIGDDTWSPHLPPGAAT